MRVLLVLFVIGLMGVPVGEVRGQVTSVDTVDLARYAGRWYEVARFPQYFQRKCVRSTVAEYTLRQDGTITVVNTCIRADSTQIRAEGRARLASPSGPTSRLEVRFAPAILSWLPVVWGDYWVLDLNADYTSALVGTPDRKYLWVLSRTPEMAPGEYERITARAAAMGFDIGRLVVSPR